MQSSRRNFGLDLLRAIAITAVFFAHGVTAMEPFAVGVDLFFVLSGFLIGRIYFRMHRAGEFKLMGFWVARWWRTLPPYLAALALFVLAEQWIPSNPLRWYYIFFLQTILGLKGFGPSWSLCVEEHFYLALPLLAMGAQWIFGTKAFRWLLPLTFFLPTLLRATSFLVAGGVQNMPDQWYRLTPYHCDGLIAGVYLAYLFVEKPEWFQKASRPAWFFVPLVFIVTIASFYYAGNPIFETLAAAVDAVSFAAWLRLAYDISWQPSSVGGRFVHRLIQGAAMTSYSIYLVHVLAMADIRVLLAQWVPQWDRGAAKSIFILGLTLVICILFYFAFEKPSIVTRDRFLTYRKKVESSKQNRTAGSIPV